MTENARLLGVRAKVWMDGRVAVLLYKLVDDELRKFYLDDQGEWQLVGEGAAYPKLLNVFHEFSNPFDLDIAP